jgi:CBS domain-containing protein
MRASDPVNRVMSASVLSIDHDAPVQKILDIFVENPIHHLPVVKDGSLVGMLSSADVMKLKFFLPPPGSGRDRVLGDKFRIATLMSAPVVTVSERDTVEHAAGLMASHGIHALPVLNRDQRLVGIVTTTDIMAGALDKRLGAEVSGEQSRWANAPERLAVLELVAQAARRYLNAGQDEQLHAALLKTLDRLDRLDG